MKPKTLPLVFEIGCEEIPARFLFDAQRQLGERLNSALTEARLLPTGTSGLRAPAVETCSTPRRLSAFVPRLPETQPDKAEEVIGPPARIAFDEHGKPTRAAESFAAKNGASLSDLVRLTTPKGEYLAIKKVTRGRLAQVLLPGILTGVISGFTFPKSMYWTAKSGPRFVRPIRWIVAVLGQGKSATVIPFEIAGVSSSNLTYGHRLNGRKGTMVRSFRQYASALGRRRVELDREKRRTAVQHELQAILEVYGLTHVKDSDLEEWIVNSTEWPHALLGSFEQRFLKLPRAILITVMRDHQKYFAVEGADGKLQPKFITVLNVDGDPRGLIRAAHERVLTARFSDAEFFWNTDQRIPLRDRLPMLEKVTYQVKLGSYADKVRRMEAIAKEICAALESQGRLTTEQTAHVLRAIQLSKCDLTTQMVQEFTELQGIVGGLYAAAQGEPTEVAEAVYDHYKPVNLEDSNPRSLVGAVASLTDKIDSVVGGFAAGLAPTGSSDPFALRRAGNGIIKMVVENSLLIGLDIAVERTLDALRLKVPEASAHPETSQTIGQFMRDRLTYYLENVVGLRHDTVRAALAAHWLEAFEPAGVLDRGRAVEKIRSSPDFLCLSQSAKRIRNIINKSAKVEDYQGGTLELDRLEAGPERDLYEAYQEAQQKAKEKRAAGDYYGALEAIAKLRPSVDLFFDKILVMAEDPDVRRNRLQLLLKLDGLFREDADLSEIETPAVPNVDAPTL